MNSAFRFVSRSELHGPDYGENLTIYQGGMLLGIHLWNWPMFDHLDINLSSRPQRQAGSAAC